MKNYSFLLFLVAIIFFSCKKEEAQKQIPPQPIKVYEVKPQSVPVFKEFVGQIYGERDIPIRARVEGFLEKIYFKEGSSVKKGQLLYAIDPDPLREKVAAEKSMVAQAKTMLTQKESDLQR